MKPSIITVFLLVARGCEWRTAARQNVKKKKKRVTLCAPEMRARHPAELDVCFHLIPFIIFLCEIPGPGSLLCGIYNYQIVFLIKRNDQQ